MCWVLSRMRTNTQFASKLPLHPWSWPMCPWQHLHVGSACSIKDISHLKQPRLITEASLFLPNSKPTLNILTSTGPLSYRLRVVTPQGVREWVRHQSHICNDITAEFDLPFDGRRQEMPAEFSITDSSDHVNSTPTTQSEPADTSSTTSERRYPLRLCRPPDPFVPMITLWSRQFLEI
ncbi:hypothetical protein MRX96_006091 [Rhipicephalus microplus]